MKLILPFMTLAGVITIVVNSWSIAGVSYL